MTLVRDTTTKRTSISDVPVACEFPDVFPDELSGLPPHREIEFCIDVVSDLGTVPRAIYETVLSRAQEDELSTSAD